MGETGECDFAVIDLVFDVGIPDDGTRDELWKHCDIHAEVQRVFLRIYFAAIDIDDVGDCLQGEKRNADGQCKIELGYELLADSAVDVMCEKALVLVETKDGDVESKVKDEQELFACCPPPSRNCAYRVTESPVEDDGEDHEPDVDWFAPCIEQQRECQEHNVLGCAFGHEEVNRKEQR